MVGRSRTCDAPRFRRPLSTELRPRDHIARDGRGWIRTSDILFVGQALSAGLSYSPACGAVEDPGQGVEPRSPHSECGVLPARRSRNVVSDVHVTFGRSRTMFSMPLACPSALDRALEQIERRPTWRGFGAGRSCLFEIRRQKQRLIQQRIQPARSAEGPFSLRRGLESELCFLKLGITPCSCIGIRLKNDEGDLLGRLRSVQDTARLLARRPPSEGWIETAPARAGDGIRVGRRRAGVCRFSEEPGGCGDHQHGRGRLHAATDDRSNMRSTQGSN